ncbi:hypothetical protein ACTXT7_016210 [Hymenolepis weldensis]
MTTSKLEEEVVRGKSLDAFYLSLFLGFENFTIYKPDISVPDRKEMRLREHTSHAFVAELLLWVHLKSFNWLGFLSFSAIPSSGTASQSIFQRGTTLSLINIYLPLYALPHRLSSIRSILVILSSIRLSTPHWPDSNLISNFYGSTLTTRFSRQLFSICMHFCQLPSTFHNLSLPTLFFLCYSSFKYYSFELSCHFLDFIAL